MSLVDINKNFKFADLTSIGLPEDKYDKILSSGLDNATLNIPGGPDKINFYAQAATDIDRQAMIDVLTIYNKEKGRLDKINTTSKDLRRLLRKVYKNYLIKDAKNVKRGGTNIIKGGSEFTAEINRLLEGRTELGELKAGEATASPDPVLKQLEVKAPSRGVGISQADIKPMLEQIKNTEQCCNNITEKIAKLVEQIGEKNAEKVTQPILEELKKQLDELKQQISAIKTQPTSGISSEEFNNLIERITQTINEKNTSFEQQLAGILDAIQNIKSVKLGEEEKKEEEEEEEEEDEEVLKRWSSTARKVYGDKHIENLIQSIVASIKGMKFQNARGWLANKFGYQYEDKRENKPPGTLGGGSKYNKNKNNRVTVSRKKIKKSLRRELNGGWGHLLNLATTFVPGGLPVKMGLSVFQKAAPHLINMAKNRLAQNPQLQQALQNPMLQQALQNPAIQSQMQNFIPPNLRPFTNMIQQQWQQPQYTLPQQFQQEYQPIVPYRGPKYYGGNSSSSDYSDSEESNTSTIYGGELSYAFDPNTGETCLAEAEAIDYQNLQPTNGEAWERNPRNRGQSPPPCNENNPAIINWKQAAAAGVVAAGLAAVQNNQARANYNAQQALPQFQDIAQNPLNANYAQQWQQAQNQANLNVNTTLPPGQPSYAALPPGQPSYAALPPGQPSYATLSPGQPSYPVGTAQNPEVLPSLQNSTGAGPFAAAATNPSGGVEAVAATAGVDKNEKNWLVEAVRTNLPIIRDTTKRTLSSIGGFVSALPSHLQVAWSAVIGVFNNPVTGPYAWITLIVVILIGTGVGIASLKQISFGQLLKEIFESIGDFFQAKTKRMKELEQLIKEKPNTKEAENASKELKELRQTAARDLLTEGAIIAGNKATQDKPKDETRLGRLKAGFSDFGAKYGKQIAIGTALAAAATALGAYGYKKVAEGNYQWKEDGLQEELERYIKETYGAEKLPVIKQIVDNVIVDIVNSTEVNNIVGEIKSYKDAETLYNKLTTPDTDTDITLDNIIHTELKEEIGKTQNTQKGGGNFSIPFIQFGGGLQENIEKYANLQNDNDKQDFIQLIDEDPKYSPETTQIATIDRTIFIVGTYIIRTLVLLMIDWGINSHMITTFKQSFEAYISGYIALFLVWVAIANISENEYQENIVLSSLFYYINTRANKLTTFRILLHIFVQISLIPILFIVKYKSSEIDQDSFEQRQGLYNAISQFSFFIWLMTSIIASRF